MNKTLFLWLFVSFFVSSCSFKKDRLPEDSSAAINTIAVIIDDQLWNGVTVLHFAKLVSNIICHDKFRDYAGVHHVVPANVVTKDSLLKIFARVFNREDLQIESRPSGRVANMTLSTNNPNLNKLLWNLAGYSHPLTIEEMILEYSSLIRSGG